ncbi:putative regulatory protein [Salmonella bongori]|nr:putative regulatory protein [Salmonella bongori]
MGFALYGPHMLFAVGCLDVTHKDAAGSVTGFRGLFSYVGAAMAGVPVIMVKNSWAWSGVYIYGVNRHSANDSVAGVASPGCIGYKHSGDSGKTRLSPVSVRTGNPPP